MHKNTAAVVCALLLNPHMAGNSHLIKICMQHLICLNKVKWKKYKDPTPASILRSKIKRLLPLVMQKNFVKLI